MSYMKQTLRRSRSASGSIDYPGPRVYGCLSPDDPDDIEIPTDCEDESICPVCRGTGSVPSEHGPKFPYSCPNCTREDHLAPQQYP